MAMLGMAAFSLAASPEPSSRRPKAMSLPTVSLRPASQLKFPGGVDSNSPAHWDGDRLYVFNSVGHPYRSFGPDLLKLGEPKAVSYDNAVDGGRWIEATWRADDGALYGWHHFEPAGVCPGTTLTAPKIGAARSFDNGATWKDLGIVLEAKEGTLKCDAQNGYFAGGHGDFSIMLDKEYLYFFFGNYAGDVADQGVGVARMAWKDRDAPVGKVWKWHKGRWREPGLGGAVTPIFPAFVAWERKDCDAFWGPSIHWNTHLQQYVMLLNRARGKGWGQEGIYISFSKTLADPKSWSQPKKIHDRGAWYPQVMGFGENLKGTDKVAGKVARFFMSGVSEFEIIFSWPDEASPPAPLQ